MAIFQLTKASSLFGLIKFASSAASEPFCIGEKPEEDQKTRSLNYKVLKLLIRQKTQVVTLSFTPEIDETEFG